MEREWTGIKSSGMLAGMTDMFTAAIFVRSGGSVRSQEVSGWGRSKGVRVYGQLTGQPAVKNKNEGRGSKRHPGKKAEWDQGPAIGYCNDCVGQLVGGDDDGKGRK